MSAGLPVVTTDRGAIGETVVDGVTGFVLENPVPGEMAERLGCLLTDEHLRDEMGKAARERYLNLYTQQHADERLAEWLTQVAS